jgi:thiamine biosynthesis protein ThiS
LSLQARAALGTGRLDGNQIFLPVGHIPLFVHGIFVIATFRVEWRGMELVINGKTEQFPDGINAAQLIESLGLENERLAMEVNREIVPRSTFASRVLEAGDRIEIVRAIGGG